MNSTYPSRIWGKSSASHLGGCKEIEEGDRDSLWHSESDTAADSIDGSRKAARTQIQQLTPGTGWETKGGPNQMYIRTYRNYSLHYFAFRYLRNARKIRATLCNDSPPRRARGGTPQWQHTAFHTHSPPPCRTRSRSWRARPGLCGTLSCLAWQEQLSQGEQLNEKTGKVGRPGLFDSRKRK